jgi:hypothetical protein
MGRWVDEGGNPMFDMLKAATGHRQRNHDNDWTTSHHHRRKDETKERDEHTRHSRHGGDHH